MKRLDGKKLYMARERPIRRNNNVKDARRIIMTSQPAQEEHPMPQEDATSWTTIRKLNWWFLIECRKLELLRIIIINTFQNVVFRVEDEQQNDVHITSYISIALIVS